MSRQECQAGSRAGGARAKSGTELKEHLGADAGRKMADTVKAAHTRCIVKAKPPGFVGALEGRPKTTRQV